MPKEYKSDVELDRSVLFILQFRKGRQNAIRRWDLVEQVFGADAVAEPTRNNNNVYDRQVRESIERWRSQGQHICNVGDGGYFMASTRPEYEDFKKYYLGAAYRKLQITSMMDATADQRWGHSPRQADPAQVPLFGG